MTDDRLALKKRCGHVSVIIPAQNEEASLPRVVGDIPRDLVDEILVVNNGSRDRTAESARAAGCRVIDEPRLGYGRACLSGLAALSGQTRMVVFCDGDYADHPDQIDRLLRPLAFEGYDLVIGSRALGKKEPGAMTPQAFWGNKFACFLMRVLWGAHYTDLGPFRAVTREALQRLAMTDTDYGWTIEMQIKAVQRGLTVKEVPVDYRRRIGRSKISGTLRGTLAAGGKILWIIAQYRWQERFHKTSCPKKAVVL